MNAGYFFQHLAPVIDETLQLLDWILIFHSNTRVQAKSELLRTACRRAHNGFAVLWQTHRLGGNQFQNITPAEAPAASDTVTRNYALFSKLIHRLEMYLE